MQPELLHQQHGHQRQRDDRGGAAQREQALLRLPRPRPSVQRLHQLLRGRVAPLRLQGHSLQDDLFRIPVKAAQSGRQRIIKRPVQRRRRLFACQTEIHGRAERINV